MKKIIIVLAGFLCFWCPAAYAATTQYNSIGGVQMSTSAVTGSLALFMLPRASIATLTPLTTGQVILCQDCTGGNNTTYNICISSGLTAGGFIMISTATTTLGCR
jgi:hypothetical protein